MADKKLLELLKQDGDHWNQWRAQHRERFLDLNEADLSGADLSGAIIASTVFAALDLRAAKGLGEINHRELAL